MDKELRKILKNHAKNDILKQFEETHNKVLEMSVDWKDQEDVNSYYKEKYLARRLRMIPKDRICPSCREMKPNLRQWAANGKQCRSCAMLRKSISEIKGVDFTGVFGVEENGYCVVDGNKLWDKREECGIPRSIFAKKCGWSNTYQQRVEEGRYGKLKAETKDIIMQVFEEAGFMVIKN